MNEQDLKDDDIAVQYSRFPAPGEAYSYALEMIQRALLSEQARTGVEPSKVRVTFRNEMLWGERHLIARIDGYEYDANAGVK